MHVAYTQDMSKRSTATSQPDVQIHSAWKGRIVYYLAERHGPRVSEYFETREMAEYVKDSLRWESGNRIA